MFTLQELCNTGVTLPLFSTQRLSLPLLLSFSRYKKKSTTPIDIGGIFEALYFNLMLETLTHQQRSCRRSCASSHEIFTQASPHRAQPKTRGPERGSRPSLRVVIHRCGQKESPTNPTKPSFDELRWYTSGAEAVPPQFHRLYAISAPHVRNAADSVIVNVR